MTTGGYSKQSYSGDLWWVEFVRGCATTITERGGGKPAFSPDGKWIATFTPHEAYTYGAVGLWRTSDLHGEILFAPAIFDRYGKYAALVSERTVFSKLVWPAEVAWADDSTGFSVHMSQADELGRRRWWVPVDGSAIEPLSSLSPGPQESQIEATHHLTSTIESGYTKFLYCAPGRDCHTLARLEGEIRSTSYTDRRCER